MEDNDAIEHPGAEGPCPPGRTPAAVRRGALACGALVALAIGGTAAGTDAVARPELPTPWPEKFVNPKPAADDRVLPMPCGARMVLRPVDIPAAGWLDDRRVELGDPERDQGYKEGRRYAHIAGAFPVTGDAARRFYIAKYEVTKDQFATVMGPGCTPPSMGGRLPATDLSWFDAVAFTRAYTEWLLDNSRESVPHVDDEPGFLRLPLEEEWEFAARGGLKVSEAEFLAPVFPMPNGELAGYAWHEASGSAQGRLRPVGLLGANPLGIHDILGNAAEMMLAPFQLDHRGRPHGQRGGFVVRGGDIFTPPTQVSSALRDELNFFDGASGRAKHQESVGFRPVLTAPVIASHERLAAIKQAWESLPDPSTVDTADDAMKALEQLADGMLDIEMRDGLLLIREELAKSHAAIAEAGNRALGALIRTGAYLGKRVVTEHLHAGSLTKLEAMGQASFERLSGRIGGKDGAAAVLAEARMALEHKQSAWRAQRLKIEEGLAASRAYYGDLVIGVSRDWKADAILRQLDLVSTELRQRGLADLTRYAEVFVSHLTDYRASRRADPAAWQVDLLAIAAKVQSLDPSDVTTTTP